MFGLIGYHTKGVIAAPTPRGRIPLRSTGLDYNLDDNFDLNSDGVDDLILDYYSHQKYLVIQGTYNGIPGTEMVITGSSNWASLSTANDEIWLTMRGSRVAKKYLGNYNYQWNNTAQLAQRVHDELRELPGQAMVRGDGALGDGAPQGHHDQARELRRRVPTGRTTDPPPGAERP